MNVILFSAVWGIVMMFNGLFIKDAGKAKYIAIAGLLVLLAGGYYDLNFKMITASTFGGLLRYDSFGMIFNFILLVCTLFYLLLSGKDFERVGKNVYEYFALIFFVLCGAALITSYNNLLILFLGIEILSIPLYILTGADKRNLKSNEAALKYFLMGAFSTGLLLMGIAFLYGATGSFSIEISKYGTTKLDAFIVLGMILMLVALSFKVSAAPFHFWTPDVYDGAPTVFTSFMATIVKAAGFFAFIRLFEISFGTDKANVNADIIANWQSLISIIVVATLLIGNITAVFQQSVKRMLAYSSIAQAGFMLLAVFGVMYSTDLFRTSDQKIFNYAPNPIAKDGLLIYAAAYSLATIGIFAVLLKMKDYTFDGFNGLAKKQPLVALTTSVFLLSLAGIPLTGGFLAKYYVVLAAIQSRADFWLIIFAMLCAAVSIYYYFRIIQAMYFKKGDAEMEPVSNRFKILLVAVAVLIVLLGLYPKALILDWLTIF